MASSPASVSRTVFFRLPAGSFHPPFSVRGAPSGTFFDTVLIPGTKTFLVHLAFMFFVFPSRTNGLFLAATAACAAGMAASLLVRPGTSVTLPDDAPGALVVASLRDLLALLD